MLTALDPFTGEDILPLADCKVQLNITASDTDHDDAIQEARNAAISWAEGYSGRSLESRQFLWTIDQFCTRIDLPIGPVSAVDSVEYYETDGTDTTVDAGDYVFGNNKIVAAADASWPYADGRPGGVRITFTAGFAAPGDIPPYLLASVKLAMTALFEDRSNPDMTGAMKAADLYRSVF